MNDGIFKNDISLAIMTFKGRLRRRTQYPHIRLIKLHVQFIPAVLNADLSGTARDSQTGGIARASHGASGRINAH